MSMKPYTELNQTDRYEIAILRERGYSGRAIARQLGRSPNTISREVCINTVNGVYHPNKAQATSRHRKRMRKYQSLKIEDHPSVKAYSVEKLKMGLNPDEISGVMKRERHDSVVSKTTIYRWLYSARGQQYCRYLYTQRYEKKKRRTKTKRVMIPNRTSIWERPRGAMRRTRYGHWEVDAIVSPRGKRGSLCVAQERATRFVRIFKCDSLRTREHVQKHRAVTTQCNVLSMTFDNGIENTRHQELGVPTFFCDPYASWQKGGVENVDKLIRRYIPKGTEIARVLVAYIQWMEERINSKPRKILNYKTAYEAAVEHGILKSEECPNWGWNLGCAQCRYHIINNVSCQDFLAPWMFLRVTIPSVSTYIIPTLYTVLNIIHSLFRNA